MKNKKLLSIVAVVLFVALVACLATLANANKPKTAEGSKNITVEVVHKDGSEKVYTYSTDEEYLGKLLLDDGLITGSDSAYGLYVESVDGETADFSVDGSWWALYINGDFAQTGADSTPIYDGETYTWTYSVN